MLKARLYRRDWQLIREVKIASITVNSPDEVFEFCGLHFNNVKWRPWFWKTTVITTPYCNSIATFNGGKFSGWLRFCCLEVTLNTFNDYPDTDFIQILCGSRSIHYSVIIKEEEVQPRFSLRRR